MEDIAETGFAIVSGAACDGAAVDPMCEDAGLDFWG
jgi:hypothetical protein